MEMDTKWNVGGTDASILHKGTIKAYFIDRQSPGTQTASQFGRKEWNGGGSKTMVSSLKTTMKKSRKTGTSKLGKTYPRGAKSRTKGEN